MSKQVENARNLYIHAIQDGRVAEAQAQSVGIPTFNTRQVCQMGKKGLRLSLQISLSVILSVR